MSKEIETQEGNIFNSPMDLRHWAITLIGHLGESKNNDIPPNADEIDKLISQFVFCYNYYYEKLYGNEETE